jgi:xanthine/uracil permease
MLMANPDRSFPARAKSAFLNLVIMAVVLLVARFGLGITFHPVMVAAIAAAIVFPLLFPARFEDAASAVSWLGLAAIAYFYFDSQLLALIAGVIGLISLASAVYAMRGRPASPPS